VVEPVVEAMVGGGAPGADASVVVVGGGIAGASTCAALRRLGHRGQLRLVEAGPLVHDRPPLSKDYLAGRTDEDGLRIYPGSWFAEHDVELHLGRTAVALDPGVACVTLADGTELVADAVVLALGASARPLPVPGGPFARTLRTVADARELRALLRPGTRLVVCGAGLVGAEVGATALALGVEVTLVDPDPVPLAAVLGHDTAAALHADNTRHGARVVTDGVVSLSRADGADDPVRVALGSGEVLDADVVLAATGALAVDDLARAAGLEVVDDATGGVVVDDRQRTSSPRVLAVGDGTRRRPSSSPAADDPAVADGAATPAGYAAPAASAGHWDAARQDGEVAAAVLLGQEPAPRGAPWFWSDRHGRHVEVVGDPTSGTRTLHRGTPGPGPFAVLAWRDGVVTGAVAVDDVATARAARRLVDRRVPVDADRLATLLADPTADLRPLLRG
jgi:3-phenylpropionate/trans-cinnamate dioxygenase ferredoxin reductase subunit